MQVEIIICGSFRFTILIHIPRINVLVTILKLTTCEIKLLFEEFPLRKSNVDCDRNRYHAQTEYSSFANVQWSGSTPYPCGGLVYKRAVWENQVLLLLLRVIEFNVLRKTIVNRPQRNTMYVLIKVHLDKSITIIMKRNFNWSLIT